MPGATRTSVSSSTSTSSSSSVIKVSPPVPSGDSELLGEVTRSSSVSQASNEAEGNKPTTEVLPPAQTTVGVSEEKDEAVENEINRGEFLL